MDNLKTFARYFAAFFVIFASIGAFQMHQQKKSPEYALSYVVTRLELLRTREGTFLTLDKGDRVYWELNVQDNRARWHSGREPLRALSSSQTLWTPATEASLAAFMGGAGGWTIKDLLADLKKEKRASRNAARVTGAVLGTLVGFRIGAWLAYRWRTSPDDANIQRLLKNHERYNELKRLVFLRLYWAHIGELLYRSNGTELSQPSGKFTTVQAALRRAETLDYELGSAEFNTLLWAMTRDKTPLQPR